MEGAGIESLSRHTVVPEAADGDIRLAADVVRLLFHRVFLCALVRCDIAYLVVGRAHAGSLAHVPHTSPVDGGAADSISSHYHHEHGYRLLDLLPEAAWPFLCCRNRHDAGSRCSLAVPNLACEVLSASYLYICLYRSTVSAHWFLWSSGCPADGLDGVESEEWRVESREAGLHDCRRFVDSVLALVLL